MPHPSHIYLDHAATSPLREEVLAAMLRILEGGPANPGSQHAFGRRASGLLEGARSEVGEALGVPTSWIHFVRGGTEGNNLALRGGYMALRGAGTPDVGIIHSTVEHSAIREPARELARAGVPVEEVPVAPSGELGWETLPDDWVGRTALYSFMAVNNETGHCLPLEEVGGRARAAGGWFHTDLVQAVGRIPLDLRHLPVDLATLSGHKLGGPVGTGVLVIRDGVRIVPLLQGGGQERKVRPGTQDVAGAVGTARAIRLAMDEFPRETRRLLQLRDRLQSRLSAEIPGLVVHGEGAPRAPHILNVGVPGLERETLHMALDLAGVAASPGSACSSGASGPGLILQALYGASAETRAAIRFSLGRSTTLEEVEEGSRRTAAVVGRLLERHGAAS